MTNFRGLLSLADRKLGRLDGVTQILPNPELFVAMYVKKEAVLSSQIEGTQASFVDVLSAEYNQADDQRHDDVKEVINYVDAMNWGLEQLASFPLSLRLIRNIHARLIHNLHAVPIKIRVNLEHLKTGLGQQVVRLTQRLLFRPRFQI
ncbi:MAG: Fic/DOC family N-terminal domain-containing protein [Oscillospiraceae bacterium]